MMKYERLYWAGPEHEGYHHIVDLNEGLMLASRATPGDLNAYSGARSAFVVGNDEQQCLAEAYRDARHAMCSPRIREVGIFRDFVEAQAWVDASVVSQADS